MLRFTRQQWLAIGAIAAGAAAYGALRYRQERRRQFRAGEIWPLRGTWTRVNGQRIFAWTGGPRGLPHDPVVLIHGMGISSSYLIPTAERLATRLEVFAPDLPGHGKSDTPPAALSIPELADVLIAWLDQMGLARVSLLANSMGCQVAVDVAVRYPERVSRLVLTGPTIDPAQHTFVERAWLFFIAGFYEKPSLKWYVVKDYSRMGRRVLAESRLLQQDHIERKLPLVRVPTLLVRGANDTIAPRRWLLEAAELLRISGIVEIPRWGHAVTYSAAAELVRAVMPFLLQDFAALGDGVARVIDGESHLAPSSTASVQR